MHAFELNIMYIRTYISEVSINGEPLISRAFFGHLRSRLVYLCTALWQNMGKFKCIVLVEYKWIFLKQCCHFLHYQEEPKVARNWSGIKQTIYLSNGFNRIRPNNYNRNKHQEKLFQALKFTNFTRKLSNFGLLRS